MSRNVPEPRMCFIGNKAERNRLPIKSLYFVPTFPSGIIKFESKERAMSYSHDCIALCNLAENIHFMHDGAERDRRWREEWLSLVEDFKQHWGVEMVPPDIRHSVGTVEEGLHLRRTVWPDLEWL